MEREMLLSRDLAPKWKRERAAAVGLLRLRKVFGLVCLFKLENFELSPFKYRRERFTCKEKMENTEKRTDYTKFKFPEKVGDKGNSENMWWYSLRN